MPEPLTARDAMSADVRTVWEGSSIENALTEFRTTRFGGFPVTDAEMRVVGILSQSDAVRALAAALGPTYLPLDFDPRRRSALTRLHEDLSADHERAHIAGRLLNRTVREIMSPDPVTFGPDALLEEVCEAMVSRRIHRVIVTEDRRAVGIISALDITRLFAGELRAQRRLHASEAPAS